MVSAGTGLAVDIAASIEGLAVGELQTTCGPFHAPGRLVQLERDSRWTLRYVVVSDRPDGRPILVVPLWRSRLAAWTDPVYERTVAALSGVQVPMSACLLVGGYGDVPAGVLRPCELAAARAREAAAAAAERIYRIARDADLCVAAPLVPARERPLIARLLGSGVRERAMFGEARLELVGDGPEDFLASLHRDQRKKVRKEWRARAAVGLTLARVEWEATLGYAPAMICDVTRRHGLPEHPALVLARLEQWLEVPDVELVGFEARRDGRVIAVSLGIQHRDVLAMYVVGMVEPGDPDRLPGYAETTIYQPLVHAYARGCREVSLGFQAVTPKHQRGASITDATSMLVPTCQPDQWRTPQ